jgi:hypothetical protein
MIVILGYVLVRALQPNMRSARRGVVGPSGCGWSMFAGGGYRRLLRRSIYPQSGQ